MASSTWRHHTQLPPLEDHQVQVWRIESFDHATALHAILSAEEQARAQRYRIESARMEFIVARACLRLLLGNLTSVPPVSISFHSGPQGKPSLTPGSDIQFNVTHSHGVVLIAIARGFSVGIDVERIDPSVDWADIAHDHFTPRETSALHAAASPQHQIQAFYQCWTQKEAITKADGRGLTLSLSSFEVPIEGGSPGLATLPDGLAYTVQQLPVGSDHIAALAHSAPCAVTTHQAWFPSSLLASI